MPVVEGAPTGGAGYFASLLQQSGQADQDRGLALFARYLAEKDRHRSYLDSALGSIKQHREQEEAAKAAEEGTPWGAIGGAALGAALAIPTFGLSLAAAPAILGTAGLGSTLGGAAFDRNPGRGAAAGDALNNFGDVLYDRNVPNPAAKVGSPVQRAAEGGEVTGLPARQGQWASSGGGATKAAPKKVKSKSAGTGKGVALLSPDALRSAFEKRGVVENPYFERIA